MMNKITEQRYKTTTGRFPGFSCFILEGFTQMTYAIDIIGIGFGFRFDPALVNHW